MEATCKDCVFCRGYINLWCAYDKKKWVKLDSVCICDCFKEKKNYEH